MRHNEDSLQISCVRWFSMQYPQYALLLHHSPNGGKRNAREAARFKAMGTKAGFPDLFLCVANAEAHGLFIELKTLTGRQTPAQKAWQESCREQGYEYAVCRSIDDFIICVSDYFAKVEEKIEKRTKKNIKKFAV